MMEKKYYSAMAITSFVLGIISLLGGSYMLAAFFVTVFIVPVSAIAFGFIGLHHIKKNNKLRGKILAWIGIGLGFVGILSTLIGSFFVKY
jgi:hypothetical protein